MKIELQYRGQKFNIYAIINDDGRCPSIDFLEQVKQNDPASHKSLVNLYTRHADHGPIKNIRKSRLLRGNLLEFKSRQGDRILYFYLPAGKTILTNGFHKGVPAETEYRKAERMREQFLREGENV
ncbi:MAG: hypothetical protein A2Z28_01550 [Chloroflexi bacterium RBG_16_51_9]|nr:MAG: hypothetical protein A2Z28_01550 [Chloroflexi bacterium RBG_16_51_9]